MAFAALTIDLNAKLAKFEQDMQRATKSLDGLDRKANAAAAGLKTAFGALGATLSIGALASFAKSGIDAADALQDMSNRTGVAVKTLAEYKLAADQSDTSLESLSKGIQKLTLSIGQAEQGSKEQAKALQNLGVTARDPKQAFEQLAESVASSNNPIKTNADLQKVLGKNYAELLPLLQGGAQGLRDSAEASKTFAEQMERLAPDAAKFNDQLDLLKTNAAGASATILAELVPALNEVFERIGLVKDLIGAGGLFNTLVNTAGTSDLGEVMSSIRTEIELTQQAIDGKKASGRDSSAFEEKLKGLNAQLQILIENRIKAFNAPPDTETMRLIKADRAASGGGDTGAQIACISDGGTWANGKCTPKKSGKTIDKASIVAEDLASAWKEADRELKQYIDDERFIAEGDLDRSNDINAIQKSWEEAGRAIEEAMRTPMEKANLELGRLDEMLERGVINWETYSRAVFNTFDAVEDKSQKTNEFAKELGLTFSSAFEDAVVGGKKFSDVLKGLAQDMLRIFARKAITEPLANAAGSWAASLFPSANGNVFSSPALSAYSGSVVSSPTVFPFASGIGLMGEAGAEAILPLKRGRDGKLGVSMDGGGGGVVIQYNIDARGADVGVEQRIRRVIKESEDSAVHRSVQQVKNLNQRGQLRLT
jgi:hypothetical protein